MKKIFMTFFMSFVAFHAHIFAQLSVEAFPMNPQTGQYNYFGVRVTLAQASTQDVTVEGTIREEGNPNVSQPFSLTVIAGNLTVETDPNFLATCPTCAAEISDATLTKTYGGVQIKYEINGCILKFNSLADVNSVINQLNTDYDTYNDSYDSQYPNLTADQLDDMDEVNRFDEFKVYRDFEALFGGFCSKRAEIENTESSWLNNNFTGTSPDEIDLTIDDGENTIFNNFYSFKVGNDLYQYTISGWYINGVYQDDEESIADNNKSSALMNGNWHYSKNSAGPMQNSLDYRTSLSNCKSNKKKASDPINLAGTNRHVVIKVAIHSIGVTHSIKSKTSHYRMKNGKLKKTRTQLQVRVDGIIRNTICEGQHNEFRNDPYTLGTYKRRSSLRARTSDIGGPIWRTFQGDVVGTFWTSDGYSDYHTLTW